MTDSPRSRFRLPHWGWFLLATHSARYCTAIVLVIAVSIIRRLSNEDRDYRAVWTRRPPFLFAAIKTLKDHVPSDDLKSWVQRKCGSMSVSVCWHSLRQSVVGQSESDVASGVGAGVLTDFSAIRADGFLCDIVGMNPLRNKPRGPLTLLMTSRRAQIWAAFVVVVPMLYIASFGPASWIVSRTVTGISAYRIIYCPIDQVARYMQNNLPVIGEAFDGYCQLLVPEDKFVDVGTNNEVGPEIYINGGWPIDVDQVNGLPAGAPSRF